MAKFAAVILKHRTNSGNQFGVKIRVSHNYKTKYIATPLVATPKDLTKKGDLKQGGLLMQANAIIATYIEACNKYAHKLDELTIEEVISILERATGNERFRLDFIAFATEKAFQYKIDRPGEYTIITSTINSLKKFIGRDTLDISEITKGLLTDYVSWLEHQAKEKGNKGTRAPSLYTATIRKLHNMAKEKYNDEDLGVINIPQSPFGRGRFTVPKTPMAAKRSLPLETIKKIAALPYRKETRKDRFNLFNLAKDLFMLSFYTFGTNAVDFYNLEYCDGDHIEYDRAKVKTRREDAQMNIRLSEDAKYIIGKYTNEEGAVTLNQRYANHKVLNHALSNGLKAIAKEIGEENLQFYSARHSWATIAINKVGISKIDVHEALCHVLPELRITDTYITKDWERFHTINKKVLGYCDIRFNREMK